MDKTLLQILIGAAGGAGATIAVALLYAPISYLRMRRRRKEQIVRISNTISDLREKILAIGSHSNSSPQHQGDGYNDTRRMYYNHLLLELETDLSDHAFDLTGDQKEELRNVFSRPYIFHKHYPPNLDWYIDTFKRAESIEWLQVRPVTQSSQ